MKQIAKTKGALLRVLACVWAVVALALAGVTPAFADDAVKTTANIVVEAVEANNGAADVTSGVAYKVIDINWDATSSSPKDPMYQWNNAVAGWVRANYSAYIGSGSDNTVTEQYEKDMNADASKMKTFAEALQLAVKNSTSGLSISPAANATVAGETLTFADMQMGGYLISVTGKAMVYSPIMKNVAPTFNDATKTWEFTGATVAAQEKRSSVTFDKGIVDGDKLVNTATAKIGSDVTFRLTAAVPSYPDNAINTKFTMSDTLSAGLTYHDGLVVKAGDRELTKDSDYTVTVADQTVTIDFKYASIKGASQVTAEYKAMLNKDAVVSVAGNPNDAKLEYASDPYTDGTYEMLTDKVKVFTFGVKIYKVDKANDTKLTGAIFKAKSGGAYLNFVKLADGQYRLATADEQGAEELEVDANGALDIKGLDAGSYQLEEVKAPEGYMRINTPLDFELKAVKDTTTGEYTGHLEGDSVTEGSFTAPVGYIAVKVTNGKGWSLPSTGDMGIFALVAAGILLVGGGIMVVRGRRAE